MPAFAMACPHCGERIDTDDEQSGQTIECPHCGQGVVVPQRTEPVAEAKVGTIIEDEATGAEPADPDGETIHHPESEGFVVNRVARAFVGTILLGMVASVGVCAVLLIFNLGFFRGVILPLIVIGTLTGVYIWFQTKSITYKLTDQRLFMEKGIIGRHVEEVELFRVKDVSVAQNIWESLLGVGRVTVLSSDDSMPTLIMSGIPNPVDVKEKVREAYQAIRKRDKMRATEFIPS